ncbi:ribosome biogenesis GTPase YlqF [Peribacillus frigoritolerans]|uniref:ribosome biogenesis GTPase YlqF n=1 Tax=Peribacillus frigoritolerans TaxID=450367 RepID=UPI0007BEDA3D|nr:ribosome biogenesis GTPase YlqF [Peribacillus frigoritolerans]PRS36873.1 ribosome biogenesis GTPase YlqF [Bacillus sp. RJGP41]QNK51064.1 ribosome biogenesis GTPase YlqF [Brevibacterium sp. PAMC23299]MCY8936229.1 ribosome biogenesis GTPase YlqF [Peribacillus frigoritolerans]MDG4846477.1 ribosome biogenesis GTPase YlqF [Peribacillus frigoritolerans]WHX68554.1 ribosome biogenesis GTPase YlqF [Peribacillus frigoritolerans]
MTIQWFPGHMAKARREVTEKLKLIDIIFELVDARIPASSRNPMIDEIIQHKPRVILLNKADMADPAKTNMWLEHYKSQGKTAIAINSQAGNGLNQITAASKNLLKEKYERMESRGIKPRAIRAMIVGIPNVGKSTLINRLAKKNIAKTGNTPGVTKAQQWIKVGKELELLDTPGILWPKFEDQEVGLKLALTGAIKDTILNLHEVSLYGLRFLEKEYPERLKSRYNLDVIPQETLELFDAVGKFRGCLASGGFIDYDKTAELVVREIRSEKMGPLTFEVPSDYEKDDILPE